jgi:hypothetical protein
MVECVGECWSVSVSVSGSVSARAGTGSGGLRRSGDPESHAESESSLLLGSRRSGPPRTPKGGFSLTVSLQGGFSLHQGIQRGRNVCKR